MVNLKGKFVEGWIFITIAILQPLLIMGIHFFTQGPTVEKWVDLLVRLLLLGIAVWIRRWLFPAFRLPRLGVWLICLVPVFMIATMGRLVQWEGPLTILTILDGLVTGILTGMILETMIAVLLGSARPSQTEDSPGLSERLKTLRTAVVLQKQMLFALAVLILLGLYAVARCFLFDWVIYSRLAVLFAGLCFLIPLLTLRTRNQRSVEEELARVEQALEDGIDRQLVRSVNDLDGSDEEDVAFWVNYRNTLTECTHIPLTWEDWVYLLLVMSLILLEPYLFGAWAL